MYHYVEAKYHNYNVYVTYCVSISLAMYHASILFKLLCISITCYVHVICLMPYIYLSDNYLVNKNAISLNIIVINIVFIFINFLELDLYLLTSLSYCHYS